MNKKTYPAQKIQIFLMAAALLLAACGQEAPQTQTNTPQAESFQAILLDPPWTPVEFTLTDHHGSKVSLTDFEGKYILIYFGFTYCPEECPATLGIWKTVHAQLGSKAEQVKFVMITVDPERDTPARLKEFMAFFHQDFIGLTGTLPEIEDAAAEYRISFKKEPLESDPDDYQILHTTQTFLVAPDGQVIIIFPYNTGPTELLNTLEDYLN